MSDIFYVISFSPDARDLKLYSDVLKSYWGTFLITIFVINILLLGFFYFLTKPNKTALVRYWIITAILIVAGPIISFVLLYAYRDKLLQENQPWELRHTISVIFNGFLSSIEFYLIVFILVFGLLLFISFLLPVKWQLKAMRRYPFKWIP